MLCHIFICGSVALVIFFLSFPFLKTLSGPGLEELNEALYQWPLAPI